MDIDLRGNIATIKIIILNNNSKLNYVTIKSLNGLRPRVGPIRSGRHGYETQAKRQCRAKTQRACSYSVNYVSLIPEYNFIQFKGEKNSN